MKKTFAEVDRRTGKDVEFLVGTSGAQFFWQIPSLGLWGYQPTEDYAVDAGRRMILDPENELREKSRNLEIKGRGKGKKEVKDEGGQ